MANVESGKYSIAVIQDLNENRKLDTNFLGIPKDPYGFSCKWKRGAASFEDVAESGRIYPHAIISCMAADTIARRSTLMKPRGDWRLNA